MKKNLIRVWDGSTFVISFGYPGLPLKEEVMERLKDAGYAGQYALEDYIFEQIDPNTRILDVYIRRDI